MTVWDTIWKCELAFEMLLFSFIMCRHFVKKSFFLAACNRRKRNLSLWLGTDC